MINLQKYSGIKIADCFSSACNLLGGLIVTLLAASAWITHIMICLDEQKYEFLFFGAIVFPVGIFHGAGVWVGIW